MPKPDKLTRVHLVSGEQHMHVLVDQHVSEGQMVTLADSADPNQWWTVYEVYETLARASINRGWNNNI